MTEVAQTIVLWIVLGIFAFIGANRFDLGRRKTKHDMLLVRLDCA
jgi:hypothetical protein